MVYDTKIAYIPVFVLTGLLLLDSILLENNHPHNEHKETRIPYYFQYNQPEVTITGTTIGVDYNDDYNSQ